LKTSHFIRSNWSKLHDEHGLGKHASMGRIYRKEYRFVC
jgi:hypothetical protein